MPYKEAKPKKDVPADQFVWVRSIFGKGPDAKKRYAHIPKEGVNNVIKEWQAKQPDHPREVASPSTITECPRVIWLLNHGAQPTNEMTWAVKQRMMLGRIAENLFAEQFADQGILIKHWKDDPGDDVQKLKMGEGVDLLQGVPDYILQLDKVAVSDCKTSRSDSFGYIGFDEHEIFSDWGWYKYRIQDTAYYMLCHANKEWFDQYALPLPEVCHLFSYALDDGVVRREITWTPTAEDIATVKRLTRRFNMAVASPTMPECTCGESFDNSVIKFCKFGDVAQGSKVADTCCNDTLIDLIKEKENV
jgi:hypothetical protein